MIPGELLRTVISYTAPNASAIKNVFWHELSGSAVDDEDAVLAMIEWVDTLWGPEWASVTSSDIRLVASEYDIIEPTDGTILRHIGETIHDIPGDSINDMNTAVMAGLITAITNVPGVLSRKYVPLGHELNVSNGAWIGTCTDAMIELLILWVTQIVVTAGNFLVPGVLSRIGQTFVPFISAGNVSDIPAYQRRRKPGIGE